MKDNEKHWQNEAMANRDDMKRLQDELEELKEDYYDMKSRYEVTCFNHLLLFYFF